MKRFTPFEQSPHQIADMTPSNTGRIFNCSKMVIGGKEDVAMTSIKFVQALALSVGMIVAGAGFSAAYACGDGSCEPPPEPSEKGNNGWGQEKNQGTHDGINAGSDNGGTAGSKFSSTDR